MSIFGIKKKILCAIFRLTYSNKLRIYLLRMSGYSIGNQVYISRDLLISDLSNRKANLIIRDRVSIGPRVILVTDSSPNNSYLLKKYPLVSGKIEICEDAWLGAGAILLPNVKIGKCTIVAAGSVVTSNLIGYSVYAGVPAKRIKGIKI